MKSAVLCAAALCLAATSAVAQNRGDITINLGQGSLSCVLASTGEVGFAATGWSLTGTNSTKFALKITPGKTSLGDLVVTRPMDVCSEQVLKAFVAGTNYPTLTLTQYSIYGTAKKAYAAMVVTLTTAFVNDYSLSGSTGNKTIETVSYAYQKVCFATTALTSAGVPGTKTTVCYDVATGKESGS